ncbi:MAG: SDR family oxidoreductase [Verrucomicrobia bacterium]|nr:SDR family oxidoreductase [Verrucomicrobiota bacterium]
MDLRGRRALVTGATGHLGRVISETLGEMGAELILVDLPGSNFKQLQTKLMNDWGTKSQVISCDLESEKQRRKLTRAVYSDQGGLNILINNAAYLGGSRLSGWDVPFEKQSLASWRRALEVNLTAIFHLTQALAPLLRVAQGANILNLGSIYGEFGPVWSLYTGTQMGNPAAYAVSKGGLLQLSRWLATTLAPAIRVNAISPGGILRGQPASFQKKYRERTPLCRLGAEDDIRGAVSFLVSDASKYVTGQVIRVDGGWGVW